MRSNKRRNVERGRAATAAAAAHKKAKIQSEDITLS